MILSDPKISELVKKISERRMQGADDPTLQREPFVLFLGAGCAEAAGAPSLVELARQTLKLFSEDSPNFDSGPNAETLSLHRFYEIVGDMSQTQRSRLFQRIYSNLAVPVFYQDLAELIKHKYFVTVLTTSIDTLLEQALQGVGLQRLIDYRVVSLGLKTTDSNSYQMPDDVDPSREPAVTIIKLHGDLAASNISITREEIDEALMANRPMVKAELRADMLCVGYQWESVPVEELMARLPGGEVWWINEKQPQLLPDQWNRLQHIAQNHDVKYLEGDVARVTNFFNELSLRLLRLPNRASDPIQNQTSDPTQETIDTPVSKPPVEVEQLTESESAKLAEEDLHGQIRRCQGLIYTLESSQSYGQADAQTEAQIAYQENLLRSLEDQLRSLPASRARLLDAATKIAEAIRLWADAAETRNPLVRSEVDHQLAQLQSAYEKKPPEQLLVGTALGALLTIASRLNLGTGPTPVVDREQITTLALYVPTLPRRA